MTAFLIDEMFPAAAAEILRTTHGHDAVHVAEVGLRAADDVQVAAVARAEGRAVVTENVADFAAERDVVLVFVLKKNLPAGGGQAAALAKILDRWAKNSPDPYLGHHWPQNGLEACLNRVTGLHGGGHHGGVDLDAFRRDGYVAVRGAVDTDTAAECRELIWAAMERRGVRRDDPGSCPPLVEGMDDLAGDPFVAAYLAPALTAAYDELIGPGRWERSVRSVDLGETVVVRFPAEDERANAGYHIEGSYAAPDGSSAGWVNIRSRNRGLLVLFLFTDVGRHDAPTRLLCGSHLAVPQFLAPYGEAGTDSDAEFWRPSVLCLNAVHATGKAGDVFLCHPFIVHTATWPHRGAGPRMIAQPAVNAPDGFVLDGSDPSRWPGPSSRAWKWRTGSL